MPIIFFFGEMHLHSQLLLLSFLCFSIPGLRLVSHDTSSPMTTDLIHSVIVVCLNCFSNLLEGVSVFWFHIGQGNSCSSLLVHQLSKPCLTFYNTIWHSHLAAQCRQPHHNLNRVHIMSNHNKLCFLALHQPSNVVYSIFDNNWFLSRCIFFPSSFLLSSSTQSQFLLSFGFWSVFVHQLEQLDCCLLVQGLRELVDTWRHLKSVLQNPLLSLKADVFWPPHKSRQVPLWLNIGTYSKVLWSFLNQHIGSLLGSWFGGLQRGSSYPLYSLCLGWHLDV